MPIVAAATLASLALLPTGPWRVTGLVRFLPVFVWLSVRGSVDVARRALHPHLPLAPYLLDYRLRLPDGLARVFLANTVSLLPGTLSAELWNDSLTVRALDDNLPVLEELETLETLIATLFGVEVAPRAVTMESRHA